jgi:hypothetical protein
MTDETYEGWTNRETWAVALHINNDQGWQESVRWDLKADEIPEPRDYNAGEIIRDSVETMLTVDGYREMFGDEQPEALRKIAEEIGSLWRVNWTELGAAFLSDLEDES